MLYNITMQKREQKTMFNLKNGNLVFDDPHIARYTMYAHDLQNLQERVVALTQCVVEQKVEKWLDRIDPLPLSMRT